MRSRRNMGKLSSRCVGDGPVRQERKLAYSPNAAQARLVLSKLLRDVSCWHEAAVCRGATSGRVLKMLRTLGALWPERRP
jgi:hypothetical protein